MPVAYRKSEKLSFPEARLLRSVVEQERMAKFSNGVDSPGYDPNKIVTASTDEAGGTGEARYRLPGDWIRAANIIIQQRLVPEYQTLADFYRDAVWHRLNWVAENYESRELDEMTAWHLIKHKLDVQDELRRKAVELTRRLEDQIRQDLLDEVPVDQEMLADFVILARGLDKRYGAKFMELLNKHFKPEEVYDKDDLTEFYREWGE